MSALINFWGSVNKLSTNRKNKLSCKKELQFEDVNLQKSLQFFEMWRFANLSKLIDPIQLKVCGGVWRGEHLVNFQTEG